MALFSSTICDGDGLHTSALAHSPQIDLCTFDITVSLACVCCLSVLTSVALSM